MRAVRLVDQLASVGGAIKQRRLPPWRGKRSVIAEHALPGGTRMRRRDRRMCHAANQRCAIGKLELRRTQADACRRLAADPAMHIVTEKILAGATEIPAAATPKHHAYQEQRQDPR